MPTAIDPINPTGWINAVLRPVGHIPWPATFLRSFLHIPGAATNPDIPPIPSGRNARVLRVNPTDHVESWTPTTGWRLDPTAEAEARDGTVAVAPQTLIVEAVQAGATRIEITSQADMGLAGDWFEIGDVVVINPGGLNEETGTIGGFGSLIFDHRGRGVREKTENDLCNHLRNAEKEAARGKAKQKAHHLEEYAKKVQKDRTAFTPDEAAVLVAFARSL